MIPYRYVHKHPIILAIAALLTLAVFLIHTPKANAAYDAGRIIDDAMFLDARSMSITEIQAFLTARGSGLKDMSFTLQCYGSGSQERQWYTAAGAQCDTPLPASQIIYYASQIYGVNPKVILATMQKEQSLTTASNPTVWQLTQAMGYACPTSGSCSSSSSFPFQIDSGTWALRFHFERARGNTNWWYASSGWTCGTEKNLYKPNLYPGQNVQFYDTNGTHYTTIYIQNAATSTMYCYTPHAYNNPQGLYGRAPYGTTGLYYSGSYNFVYFYELWFGTTQSFLHEGVNYSNVFDPNYYLANNADVRQVYGETSANAFRHFIDHGMKEGRRGNTEFDVASYKNRHPDLRILYRNNLVSYYKHYTTFGKIEGRIATGSFALIPITTYRGKSFTSVYDFSKYLEYNSDLRQLYSNDDAGAIEHFVVYGMGESRIAIPSFDVSSYRNHYFDIRRVFGADIKQYYYHYMYYGILEGRSATGTYVGGTSILGDIDYSSIYQFDHYRTVNSDIKTAYQLDDIAALRHFINYGMKEGRQASTSFNVTNYKLRYSDLVAAFGDRTEAYYIHYLYYGKTEGRSAE